MTIPPTISAVIPAHNSEQTLPHCLEAIRKSLVPVNEIIVVDDASSDRTSAIAKEHGATLIEVREKRQANYCRNLGARAAGGEFILFLDSDVVLEPGALENALQILTEYDIGAVVGLYSTVHRHPNLASQYKNLWIRYSYLKAGTSLDWIFGAIAVVRKSVFDEVGGFDHTLFMHKGGDLELGKRIAQRQPAIRFSPGVEVEHLKKHTLATLLKNDYERSQGFIQLAMRLGQLSHSLKKGFANVYPAFAYSTLLLWGVLLLFLLSIWHLEFVWLALTGTTLYIMLNLPFLFHYVRARKISEGPVVFGILILDHLVCGLGCLKGILRGRSSQ